MGSTSNEEVVSVVIEREMENLNEGTSEPLNPSQDNDGEVSKPYYGPTYLQCLPPSIGSVKVALADVKNILKPQRSKGSGYKLADLSALLCNRLEMIWMFLVLYTGGQVWIEALMQIIQLMEKGYYSGTYSAAKLRKWTKAYISNQQSLPQNNYGKWKRLQIDDEDLVQDLALHLQEIGKYVKTTDIVIYLASPEVKTKFGMEKNISLSAT